MDDGRVFSYDVDSEEKVREHSSAIVLGGYRSCDENGNYAHYPPHRIVKVKAKGVSTKYPDRVSGT